MIKKSDIVRELVKTGDYKKALRIAKDFRIGITRAKEKTLNIADRIFSTTAPPRYFL